MLNLLWEGRILTMFAIDVDVREPRNSRQIFKRDCTGQTSKRTGTVLWEAIQTGNDRWSPAQVWSLADPFRPDPVFNPSASE
jgi:hypothetical protein